MDNASADDASCALARLDANNPILDDLTCGRCGYNLRGQTVNADCPECGMSVARSARHDLLRYSDHTWLIAVANGFVPLMVCTALSLIFRIMYALAMHYYIVAPTSPRWQMRWETLTWFSFGMLLLMEGLILAGVWMITRREPDRAIESAWLRRTARAAMLISAILVLGAWVPWLWYAIVGRSFHPGTVLYVGQVAAAAASVIGMIALFVLARRLAFRIPDEQLARRTAIAAIGIIAIMIFQAVYSWTDFLGLFTITGEASRYLRHVPQAIVTAWAIALLMQYRTRIRAAIQ